MNCQDLIILTDKLYEHYLKLKSTSSYCCVEVKGLTIRNAQSNNLFLVIGVEIASKNSGNELIDRKVPSIPTNKNIAEKRLSAIRGGDNVDKRSPAIINRDIADKKLLVIGDKDIADKRPPAITNGDIADKTLLVSEDKEVLATRDKESTATKDKGSLATGDKEPPAIADKRLLATRDKRSPVTKINGLPVIGDKRPPATTDRGPLVIANKKALISVKEVAYTKAIFLYYCFWAFSYFLFARLAFELFRYGRFSC